MAKSSNSILASVLAATMLWTMQLCLAKSLHSIRLQRAELRLTPVALVFNSNGDLYVGYRDVGVDKKSSAIWIRVFDLASGKELRSVRLRTGTVSLPNGAEQFVLSPDGSLLVYSQFHGSIFLTTVETHTLRVVSEITSLPAGMEQEVPRVSGITSDNQAVLVTSEVTNQRNGVDARLVWLNAHDLARVREDQYVPNPYDEASYAIDRNGDLWFTRTDALYQYDSGRRKSDLRFAVPVSTVPAFLADGEILLYSDRNEFGDLYRLNRRDSVIQRNQRITGCGIDQVRFSPDERYGAALCEHQNLGEWRFGAITKRAAVIFDTKTLKIVAQVPIKKDLYPEWALWHGDGKIILATQSDSDKLAIFQFPVPASTGKQGADSTMP